jgi:serine/threonine protein kinase
MAILRMLSTCALYQVVGESADRVVGFLASRVSDQGRLIIQALTTASEKAWRALEVALAGESLWNKLDAADEKALRQQIRNLLENMPLPLLTGRREFGRLCLRELQEARKKGLLITETAIEDFTRPPHGFTKQTEQSAVIEKERAAIQEMSAILQREKLTNLAWLVGQEVQAGQGLLVVAAKYFFRRAVETNPVLARSVEFTRLESLTANQAAGFQQLDQLLRDHGAKLQSLLDGLMAVAVQTRDAVLDVQAEQKKHGEQLSDLYKLVLQLVEQAQMQQRREVKPGDSCTMRGTREKERVQDLVDRYEALPESERQQRPALLNTVAMLQVASGETKAAQQNFEQLAMLVADPQVQAQAFCNAYQAAIERKDFPAALEALRRAVAIAPETHAPFPFSDYVPQRILGAGGFGVAFLCQHATLKRPVVIKTLRLDGLDRDVADVFREAQVLNDLDHSAIIKLRDCRFSDASRTRPYLVMDYFESQSLADHVKVNGTLTPAEMLLIGRAVAEALQVAHQQGILHRDIKPDNLLVRKDPNGTWRVKLIDFGLAVKQEVEQATVRTPDTPSPTPREYGFAGTIDYAAPEQMGRLPGVAVGPYSDVYGFAKTCYFALLGTPEPDDSERESLEERWRRLLSQCTARKIENRVRDFTIVLERLREIEQAPVAGVSRPPVKPKPVEIPLPPLEIEPSPPPKPLAPPPPAKRSSVPPRYIEQASTPKETRTSKPTVSPLWGGTQEQTPSENVIEAVPVEESPPVGSAFGEPMIEEAPPTEETKPEEPPPPPKQPKRGPLGGAFGT